MCRQADRESSSAAFSSKLRGYEQKLDTRPVRTGEWAKHHETRPQKHNTVFIRSGKSGACAAKVIRLIQGDPSDVSVTQACLKAEPSPVNGGGVGRKSAEAVVLSRRIPATTGRAEP